MDRLKLRRLAKEANDPNCVVLAEREINDYLKPEIDALKTTIERVGNAIDEQAAKGEGKTEASCSITFRLSLEAAWRDRRMAEGVTRH